MTTSDGSLADFRIAVSFVKGLTVLTVRGEVDMLTAPDFGAFLDTMIDRGHRPVVLDLAEMNFMDASGLSVIAKGAERLKLSGGSLRIRSPSAMVERILGITGFAELICVEQTEPVPDHLGPEQSDERRGVPAKTESQGLTQHLRTVSAIPSDEDVVNSALRLVVALAKATVDGADGVSVSLRRRGRLATVAASDQTILDMDAGQYATGEGPCIDASVEGHWFHAESLDTETRWPAFTPKAQALGISAILSSPLLARDRPVGALNIYSRSPAAFEVKDQKLAAVFASEASVILSDAGVDVTEVQLAARLGEALRNREVISQAQGVIMERDGVDEDDAYTALRRFSVGNGTPLRERAQDVVASARRPQLDP